MDRSPAMKREPSLNVIEAVRLERAAEVKGADSKTGFANR